MHFLAISILFLGCICLILLSNSKFLLIQSFHKNNPNTLSPSRNNTPLINNNFYVKLGQLISLLIPKRYLMALEESNNELDRKYDELLKSLGQACFTLIFISTLSILSKNMFLLIFAFAIAAFIVFEAHLSAVKHRTRLEQEVPHLIACLKILSIKSETSIKQSLEIIRSQLPAYMQSSHIELKKFLNQIEQSSIEESIERWGSQSQRFKDFLLLILAIHEGANKKTIQQQIDSFLVTITEEQEASIKERAENLQLYLIGPVILMFLISMQPMVSVIHFVMNSTL